MSNNIKLRRGLDIPIAGPAALQLGEVTATDIIAVKPGDFKGLAPRLLVREGDRVLAGSPVLADKQSADILITAPVSGTVEAIVRGEKRKLLEVRIRADKACEYLDFGAHNALKMTAAEVCELLCKSGLWAGIVQRPYGILAQPGTEPKAIFISAFSTAPLAADTEFTLRNELQNIQAGIDALAKLTKGGIHFSINATTSASSPFHKVEHVIMHEVSGKHPAGNVGIQIANLDPIQKGETVWTMSLMLVAAIGRLMNTGKVDLRRKVALTGPVAKDPCYVEVLPGTSMKAFAPRRRLPRLLRRPGHFLARRRRKGNSRLGQTLPVQPIQRNSLLFLLAPSKEEICDGYQHARRSARLRRLRPVQQGTPD